MNNQYISKRLNGVYFGYYSSHEIRNLSVKEITSAVAFDQLNRPLKGGLCDPAMGVSPYDRFSRCVTCGQEGLDCPGHIGHIELLFPVYNAFVMDKVLRLLRSKCHKCHRLKMSDEKLNHYYYMFILVKLGYLTERYQYQNLIELAIHEQQRINKQMKISKSGKNNQNQEDDVSYDTDTTRSRADSFSTVDKSTTKKRSIDSIPQQHSNKQENVNRFQQYDSIQTKIEDIQRMIDIRSKVEEFENGAPNNNAINKNLKELSQQFWLVLQNQKKCPHCNQEQPKYQKEGFSKFFIVFSKKNMKNNQENNNQSEESEIENSDQESSKKNNNHKLKKLYLNVLSVKNQLKQLWIKDSKVLNLLFGSIIINKNTFKNNNKGWDIISNNYNSFFLDVIPVPPNRFRPDNTLGDQTFLHNHSAILSKILLLNNELKQMIVQKKQQKSQAQSDSKQELAEIQNNMNKDNLNLKKDKEVKTVLKKVIKITDTIQKMLEIQDAVNCFLDSSKANKQSDKETGGIKQLLEKKEGLFRMKMMGKRVNFAARSVISPDPNLNTNEVGVPQVLAKRLTFAEHVNQYNFQFLRQLIINGPNIHPGANAIEENGIKILLETRTNQQRLAIANQLLKDSSKKVVYRHLMTGDAVLFNRQPTLHKPSIMCHKARVLPKEQTIRMHYANCNSYNADFDGDEMNLHFLQNHLARSEAQSLALTDKIYIVPKDGKPIRGLIQDSIVSAVFITMKDTFITKEDYMQLIYQSTQHIIDQFQGNTSEYILKPAIMKPKRLWTGKQVISSILKIVQLSNGGKQLYGLNMDSKAKTPEQALGPFKEEVNIIIRDSELLQGILDKNQIGASENGLIHCFFELYDDELTGKLLTAFAKLFTFYLQQYHGFTCSIEDLKLTQTFDVFRREKIDEAHSYGLKYVAQQYCDLQNYQVKKTWNLCNRPHYKLDSKRGYRPKVLSREPEVDYLSRDNEVLKVLQKKICTEKNASEELDREFKQAMNHVTSDILKITNYGLLKSFPENYFSAMVLTGAKGSTVNHNQVSLMLGQQELEGRRVPIMPSGRSLPSFLPYDPNPRSGGYITDRFLTGLRPQDFFFHCMAGREGLIDTAVKTSRSGYLQRCLVKHLEGLVVAYDLSVRDSDGQIVQFYYGEDCLDPTKKMNIQNYQFIQNNFDRYKQKYRIKDLSSVLDTKSVKNYLKQRKNMNPQERASETILSKFNPGQYLGAISEKAFEGINQYFKNNKKNGGQDQTEKNKQLFSLLNYKYLYTLIHPGDAVGPTAAQSIGEPSTQMTLNTFHLAGHGGANVTLGIPRLREILMTATNKIKTPMMTLTFKDNVEEDEAKLFMRKMQKVNMLELINRIKVDETKEVVDSKKNLIPVQSRMRVYKVEIQFEKLEAIQYAFGLNEQLIKHKIKLLLISNVCALITKQLKKDKQQANIMQISGNNKNLDKEEELDELEHPQQELNEHNESDLEDNFDNLAENEEDDTSKKTKSKARINEGTSESDAQEEKMSSNPLNRYCQAFKFKNGVCKLILKLPLECKKLLMVQLIEQALKITLVNEVRGINKTHLVESENKVTKKKEFKIQTEGVNYKACWNCHFLDHNKIQSNDICSIHNVYGIEAARNSIIKEIVMVFSVYHITVDFRHLSLIADYMTYASEIRPLNRSGMQNSASAFLRMSFETTMQFLTQASISKEYDNNSSPSSQIVLGRVAKVGTGCFEIRHMIKK